MTDQDHDTEAAKRKEAVRGQGRDNETDTALRNESKQAVRNQGEVSPDDYPDADLGNTP